jgi:hypothetical protein
LHDQCADKDRPVKQKSASEGSGSLPLDEISVKLINASDCYQLRRILGQNSSRNAACLLNFGDMQNSSKPSAKFKIRPIEKP